MWHIKMDIISFSQIWGLTFIISSIFFLMLHLWFYAAFRPVDVSFGQWRWWLSLHCYIKASYCPAFVHLWQHSVLVFYPFHLLVCGLAVFQTHNVCDLLSNRDFWCNKQALLVHGYIIFGISLITYCNHLLLFKKVSPISS